MEGCLEGSMGGSEAQEFAVLVLCVSMLYNDVFCYYCLGVCICFSKAGGNLDVVVNADWSESEEERALWCRRKILICRSGAGLESGTRRYQNIGAWSIFIPEQLLPDSKLRYPER